MGLQAGQHRTPWTKLALKVALVYLFASALWIVVSDYLLGLFSHWPWRPPFAWRVDWIDLSIAKGLLFVLLSATLLYVVIALLGRRILRSEGLLRAYGENASDVLFRFECAARPICNYISDSVFDLTGLQAQQIRENPKILLRWIHPEDRPLITRIGQRADSAAMIRWLEDNGGIRYIEIRSRSFAGPAFSIIEGVARDVTARETLQREQETLNRRLHSVVEGLPGLAALLSADRRIHLINDVQPPLAELLRARSGGPAEMLFGKENQTLLRSLIDRAEVTGGPAEEFLTLPQAGGKETTVQLRVARLRQNADAGPEFVLLALDNSRQVQLRQHLERAGRLALLGEMMAAVGHEINQPLTVLQLAAYNLIYEVKQTARREIIQQQAQSISENVDRAVRLMRQLRSFASDDRNEARPFSPAAAVDGMLTLLHTRLNHRNIEIEWRDGAAGWQIQGDCPGVEQALINIVNNAIDAFESAAMERGRIVIESGVAEDGLWISIWNNGPPIPEEARDQLFEPFYSTKPAGKGTGLGLSISERIMRDHSGALSVQNHDGGVRFLLSFPAYRGTRGLNHGAA